MHRNIHTPKSCWQRRIFPCKHALCGSGIARESGVSVPDMLADTPHSRASPLPQESRFHVQFVLVA
ncbi:hypothetical protein CWC48_24015 [Pseudomonas sp. S10E 269]|nr:hypothetical protein CWC49_04465 [Pseudomonas sp. S09F 262]PJK42072.1 hypothetical protein CWC48_24015 [Pseudomonas sp. S10E 269]